jgi:hypothetical protein
MSKEDFIYQIKGIIQLADFADKLCALTGSDNSVIDDSIGVWVDGLIKEVNSKLNEGLEMDYFYDKFYRLLTDGDIEAFSDYYDNLAVGFTD